MNPTNLFPIAIDLLAKSSGILLLAFALNSLWRNASAARRCLSWGAAFAALLLLPLTLLVPPHWSFTLERAEEATTLRLPAITWKDTATAGKDLAGASATVPRRFPRVRAEQLADAVWIAGVAWLLCCRGLGSWQVRRLHRQSNSLADARVTALTARLADGFGIRRPIELLESPQVTVPLTWGVLRPVLLLPRKALTWSDAALEAALAHELGHIRHGDALTRMLAWIVSTAFWPNVLVWLAAKAWRTSQEQACDDLVLRSGAATEDYALQLLEAARDMNPAAFPHAPVLAMARRSTLETRLSAIMDGSRDRRPVNGRAWLAAGIAGSAVLTICATMQLRAQDKPTEDIKVIDAVPPGEAAAPKPVSKEQERASKIILPKVVFRDAPLADALEYLREQGMKLDPDKAAMNFILRDPESAEDVRITLDLTNVPLTEALRYVAELGGRTLRFEAYAVLLDSGPPPVIGSPQPPAESPLMKRAAAIILPSVEFNQAPLQDAVEYLRLKSKQQDELLQGVNIILRLPKDQPAVSITLTLQNAPLSEALHYVAELGGLKLRVEENAIVLEPK